MRPQPAISAPRRGIPAFSVLLIMAALTVIGVAVLPMLNVQYTPAGIQRRIDVSFGWPGASARLVEQQATSRIEAALSTVSGCEGVSSQSDKGRGSVTVRFRKGTDMEAARFEVASAIRNLRPRLPDEITYPAISLGTGGSRQQAALVYVIKADLPSERIEEYVTACLSTPLAQVAGVDRIDLSGVTPYEWVVTFDPQTMEAASISARELAAAFNNYFRNDVIGLATLGEGTDSERSIVLKLRNRASGDFGDIPVARRNGRLYHLRDLATWRWREALPERYFRINGLNTVNLTVYGEPHSNILTTTAAVKEEMAQLQRSFPPGISATLTYDASEYVSGELHKIYVRTLLCVAILLLFVLLTSRDLRYLLVIATALAVNILIAVVFYKLLRLDIHIYTLAGITVSLGIVIDTAIVMVDHYSYHRNRRVFRSILGALLTTIASLGIVWLLPEEQRNNLTDFSAVIAVNLSVSLLVALLFIPALLDKLLLGRSMTVASVRRKRRIVRLSRAYGRFIAWGRRHRWLFAVALVWGFGIPTFLLPDKIKPGEEELSRAAAWYNRTMESRWIARHRTTVDKVLGTSLHLFNTATNRYNYFRSPEQRRLYVNAGMAEGCTVQQLNEVVRMMENYLSRFDQIERFTTRITSYDNASIEITFRPEYEHGTFPIQLKQQLTAVAHDFGGATWRVWGIDDNNFNNNIVSSYRAHQIRLRGYDFDRLSAFAEAMIDTLARNRRVSEPEIMNSSWSLPHNEFNVRYDDQRIAASGLVVDDYYRILHTMLYKTRLTPIYDGGSIRQVVLESGNRDRFDRWHIINAQVRVDSLAAKLSAVGSIEKRRSGTTIRRNDQSYEMIVGFDFIGSYELSRRLTEQTIRRFNDEVLPIGFRADTASYYYGAREKRQQAWLILLIVAIIYAVCAILFESLRKPLVIILMIPFSFIGVFLLFGLTDFVFDQGGFAAFVLLCGIVVNAGIYLINEEEEWARTSRKRGVALYLKAFNHKIVPIMLTILSTVLGLVPFLYDGPEEVFWFAFAVAAICGTLFSVVALLVYLPVFLPLHRKPAEG